MTLVEVLGGLALLAAILTGLFTIKTRSARQAQLTERRRLAIQAADALLSFWWQDIAKFPRTGSGDITGRPGLQWRTQDVRDDRAQSLGGQVVRLDVFDRSTRGADALLASVEVVLPVELIHETRVHPD